jgi:hypothetical protein
MVAQEHSAPSVHALGLSEWHGVRTMLDAASPVVPVPAMGSSTHNPGGEPASAHFAANSTTGLRFQRRNP